MHGQNFRHERDFKNSYITFMFKVCTIKYDRSFFEILIRSVNIGHSSKMACRQITYKMRTSIFGLKKMRTSLTDTCCSFIISNNCFGIESFGF